ncbi:nose resistant to fluoxetine protein 6-like [Polistes fuscatus]|uniref:nose resistant to fluoxetine protein 6-like n=1 Tax=Polistes fuscatus TaxID=30207 RepID=UPI001CA9F7C1|nr:nose resistant to fluoxetine protein 6-like [Polistes fuscatus]
MVWIVLIHKLIYVKEYIDNKKFLLRKSEDLFEQVISNGTLSVDTFLFFGGFLCMTWSWYLAIDMQYYVIITFLLFLSSMYFKVASSLLILMFTLSIILTGYFVYIYDYEVVLDKQYSLSRVFYYSPLVRIGPYLVGVIAAYIVVKLNHKLLLKKKSIIVFWILGSLCNLIVLFGLYPRRVSGLGAVFYTALSRTV